MPCVGAGCFVKPVVFVDVDTTAEVWREEIFGPVLCVKTFETDAEVHILK